MQSQTFLELSDSYRFLQHILKHKGILRFELESIHEIYSIVACVELNIGTDDLKLNHFLKYLVN